MLGEILFSDGDVKAVKSLIYFSLSLVVLYLGRNDCRGDIKTGLNLQLDWLPNNKFLQRN